MNLSMTPLSYHSSNLSLVSLETMRLVQIQVSFLRYSIFCILNISFKFESFDIMIISNSIINPMVRKFDQLKDMVNLFWKYFV